MQNGTKIVPSSHCAKSARPYDNPSLERDVFPRLLSHGVYALEQRGMFIDIGTPEDYARAQELCERLYKAALLQPQTDSESRKCGN